MENSKAIVLRIKSLSSGKVMEFTYSDRKQMERDIKMFNPNHFEIVEIDEDQQTMTF
jgi:hypothetical protein